MKENTSIKVVQVPGSYVVALQTSRRNSKSGKIQTFPGVSKLFIHHSHFWTVKHLSSTHWQLHLIIGNHCFLQNPFRAHMPLRSFSGIYIWSARHFFPGKSWIPISCASTTAQAPKVWESWEFVTSICCDSFIGLSDSWKVGSRQLEGGK